PERPRCSLWSALERRRSTHDFDGRPIGLRTLATLLDAGYGLRDGNRRSVPSGGALYPLELHVARRSGVWRYDPVAHALEQLDSGDPWPLLEEACPFPGLLEGAAAVLPVLAVFGRTRFKYGQRGYRFALLEAGHLVQNVVLAAAALDVRALPLGGFYDSELDALVGADGLEQSSVYAVLLGGRGGQRVACGDASA